jgi:hypothetical protein
LLLPLWQQPISDKPDHASCYVFAVIHRIWHGQAKAEIHAADNGNASVVDHRPLAAVIP